MEVGVSQGVATNGTTMDDRGALVSFAASKNVLLTIARKASSAADVIVIRDKGREQHSVKMEQ